MRSSTTITHRQLRNDSASILRRVEHGESFVVTNNGVRVAELTPVDRDHESARRFRELVSAGIVRPAKTRTMTLPRARLTTDIDVQALIDADRRDR